MARHLVSAGLLLDEDPETALTHAQAARALAGRIASVREAVGIAAYRAGEFGEALAELRAAKRINGRDDHLAVMADCERALGRPERALALVASPAALRLEPAARVELKIVESGIRRDLGQPEAAVLALQEPDLDGQADEPWAARLWYAYAAALLDAGRTDEAVRWFRAVLTVDDGETDAEERLAELAPMNLEELLGETGGPVLEETSDEPDQEPLGTGAVAETATPEPTSFEPPASTRLPDAATPSAAPGPAAPAAELADGVTGSEAAEVRRPPSPVAPLFSHAEEPEQA